MTIKAFECVRSWNEVPLTVFAENLDHADLIYRGYVASHHPEQPEAPTAIYMFCDERLEVRPHLERACLLGVAGVGYWESARNAWIIRNPEDEVGLIAPPSSSVSYYYVTADEGDDARVFAESYEQATSFYCVWHVERWGSLPHRFTMEMRSRWELVGELATLRDGLNAEMTGIGAFDEDGIMRILPPDHEAIVGRD